MREDALAFTALRAFSPSTSTLLSTHEVLPVRLEQDMPLAPVPSVQDLLHERWKSVVSPAFARSLARVVVLTERPAH